MKSLLDGESLNPEEIIMACGLGIGVEKVFGLCSGGKDSLSACATAHKIRPLDGIILVDTTVPAVNGDDKPAYIAAKAFADQLGVPFICIKSLDTLKAGFEYVPCIGKYGTGKAYENYCRKYGMPHASEHDQVFRYLKKKAMVGFVMSITKSKQRVAFISGVRKKESNRREINAQIVCVDEDTPRIIWISPVYYWTTEQAYAFCAENDYKLSESYTALHLSGDCMCGAFSGREEVHLLKMFYPDTAAKIAAIEKVAFKGHKGKPGWGNGESMTSVKSQTSLSARFGCAECQVRYDEVQE
jgi:3'-phosphoadenosine 5'-phosphosulfate sulfotransferase (PAPS reductase)/FAD synthetase